MLEIWLREGRVRLTALVMLETWLWESGVLRPRNFFDKLQVICIELSHFLLQDRHLPSTPACHA